MPVVTSGTENQSSSAGRSVLIVDDEGHIAELLMAIQNLSSSELR